MEAGNKKKQWWGGGLGLPLVESGLATLVMAVQMAAPQDLLSLLGFNCLDITINRIALLIYFWIIYAIQKYNWFLFSSVPCNSEQLVFQLQYIFCGFFWIF